MRLSIVVVGRRTEKDYFNDLRGSKNPSPAISIKVNDDNPSRQVKTALNDLKSGDFEQVWLVFDVDYFESNDVSAAVTQASKSGVRVAVSNPCFEYWLILHFEEYCRYLQSPKHAEAYLKANYVKGYSKSTPNIEKFRGRQEIAVLNGKRRSKTASIHTINPSTMVWELVELILGEQQKTRRLFRLRVVIVVSAQLVFGGAQI